MALEIMKYFKLLIIIMFTGFQSTISAQDLSEHLWKDRVVLVYTEDQASERFTKQLDELKSDMKGLDDRKLVLYSITPTHFRKGWDNGAWEVRNGSLDNFSKAERNFEVVLLGLDGRVKLRQDQLLKRDRLYNTIDKMPMRQRELKSRD
jgi:predicted double-glycine peptidase